MHEMAAVSLRYFNVAGAYADPAGHWFGERHTPETHLIPAILRAALGEGPQLRLFGDDYPTPDGTCVRDYIHVTDLAKAHFLALAAATPGQHRIYNLGSGTGFSNLEVVTACREVTGRDIPVQIAPRRPGDPAVLVASSQRIETELGWQPQRGLATTVADAWRFSQERLAADQAVRRGGR
jgi:UDP-glucose 4-epimerase